LNIDEMPTQALDDPVPAAQGLERHDLVRDRPVDPLVGQDERRVVVVEVDGVREEEVDLHAGLQRRDPGEWPVAVDGEEVAV
jgi:hypothetical protein